MGLSRGRASGRRTACARSGVGSEPGVFKEHREASGAGEEGAGRGEVEGEFERCWGPVGKGFEGHHRVSWGVMGGMT